MHPSSLTDEQLAVRLCSGDMQALRVLYERWKDGLYRFAVRLVSDGAVAEDLVHDAFVSLIQSRHTVTAPAALRSWTYTVVRNSAFAYLNKGKRLRLLEETDEERIIDDAAADESVERDEQSGQIAALLDRMLPQYREVLLLREFEGMTYEEIAAVTGSTVSAVKSRLFKARRALMEQMTPLRRTNDL